MEEKKSIIQKSFLVTRPDGVGGKKAFAKYLPPSRLHFTFYAAFNAKTSNYASL